ncbi:MAG: D-TA family PLP-dependent enzyme [Planctomycetia bacterium]|nr:D-TA family PLP-dependent enzyme [Planctomycetia bacterium]
MTTAWYRVANEAEIDSPALLVYPDRVRENVRRMIEMAGGTARLRPHVKTHKMPQVIRMQLEAGIDKFKCATPAEAEMVARCGARDVFLAYQLLGPKIERFAALVKQFPQTKFLALADDEAAIRALSARLAAEKLLSAEVLLDIDNGMGRSGVPPGERAKALYRLLAELPGVRPGGLHVYDGQHRDRDPAERTKHCDEAFAPVEALQKKLVAAGLPVPRVVAGGTPTFPCHARRRDVECSPGTCVFWDASYAGKFPDLVFLHAAVLLTRVISKPRPGPTGAGRLCLDLGYKAVSPDNPDPRVAFLDLPDAKPIIHNEEHLTIETSAAERFQPGDVLYAIPFHVCPTVALHQHAVVIDGGRATERWPVVARDRFLSA